MHHCVCRPHETKTFSPLAELLPDHTLPELLFLETKWASLMSYGMTSKLLQDVLPIEEPVNTFTIRQRAADVAERLEQELGDEQFCFVEGCQRSWDELPSPDGPLTVGIDGIESDCQGIAGEDRPRRRSMRAALGRAQGSGADQVVPVARQRVSSVE